MYDLLNFGHGKFSNVYKYGPSNCGKSFLLKPLMMIYDTFSNPARGTFAWVGVDEKEIIFLNDFCWSPLVIAWESLLLLLEGDVTHLLAPKNSSARDIEISWDTPIFATADMPIVYTRGGFADSINTRIMDVGWRQFHFYSVIQEDRQVDLVPCSHCLLNL